jgi:hypothetical protein
MTTYDFEDYREDVETYIKENVALGISDPCTLVASVKLDRIVLLKVSGLWDWVLKNCPNRRVKYLMRYGKNERVRYKNFKHACRLIAKLWKPK